MNPSSGWAVGRFPLNVALAGAAAVASYFLIERPCLRLREQWERTRGSVVAAAQ
jgi:peptidoglycan/LPS O-acetylase OafA/YrhL